MQTEGAEAEGQLNQRSSIKLVIRASKSKQAMKLSIPYLKETKVLHVPIPLLRVYKVCNQNLNMASRDEQTLKVVSDVFQSEPTAKMKPPRL